MKKNQFKDEAELNLTHRQVREAIWAARLSTKFIRKHFPLQEDTHKDGSLRRFYMINQSGVKAIAPFI